MKKKSAKRYYKKRNNSKMSSQDFSRKLIKALNKAMTRKKMMFGGVDEKKVLQVDIEGTKITKVDYNLTDSIDNIKNRLSNKEEGFSGFSKIYTDGNKATAYMEIILDNGKDDSGIISKPITLNKIEFDSTVFEKS